MNKRHIGRFTVNKLYFEDLLPEYGINLFRDMVILDVIHDYANDTAEYIGIHESFRPIDRGCMVPEYEAIFDNESIYPQWVEKEQLQ